MAKRTSKMESVRMARFMIAPHMRLQEWVAEEKGYFSAEGLEYEFREEILSKDGKKHDLGDKIGAYETFKMTELDGRESACQLDGERGRLQSARQTLIKFLL